jgi:hypothetical protein
MVPGASRDVFDTARSGLGPSGKWKQFLKQLVGRGERVYLFSLGRRFRSSILRRAWGSGSLGSHPLGNGGLGSASFWRGGGQIGGWTPRTTATRIGR